MSEAAAGVASRRAELAEALGRLRVRVDRACAAAGRPGDVRTVVVTKTFPATDVRELLALGVRDVGESRDQEARAKREEVEEGEGPGAADRLRWHFLGRLQRNKAASVARWATLVHSCDRLALADALDAGARRAGRTLPVLVQVSLDPPGTTADRGGADAAEVPRVAERVADLPGLTLAGVMAVAPREVDPAAAFERLAEVAGRLRRDHPGADVVSAGMSEDLEQAVAAGATHLRVGRAVLGSRPALR